MQEWFHSNATGSEMPLLKGCSATHDLPEEWSVSNERVRESGTDSTQNVLQRLRQFLEQNRLLNKALGACFQNVLRGAFQG